VHYGTFIVPESFPTRRGPFGALGRRVAWSLTRPYFDELVRQTAERTAELNDECAILRSDLLATNHRINWLEEQLAAARTGASAPGPAETAAAPMRKTAH
jgi:hypothetical protein